MTAIRKKNAEGTKGGRRLSDRHPAKSGGKTRGTTPYTVTSDAIAHGERNGRAKYVSVRIEKDLLDQLSLERSDRLVGEVSHGNLVLRPERYLDDKLVDKVTSEVMDEYADVLKKLAE